MSLLLACILRFLVARGKSSDVLAGVLANGLHWLYGTDCQGLLIKLVSVGFVVVVVLFGVAIFLSNIPEQCRTCSG